MNIKNEYEHRVKELLNDWNSCRIFEVFYHLLNDRTTCYSEILNLFSEKKNDIIFINDGFKLSVMYPDFSTNSSKNLYFYVLQKQNEVCSFKITADFEFANIKEILSLGLTEIKLDVDYRSEKSKIVIIQKNNPIKLIYIFTNNIIKEINSVYFYESNNKIIHDEKIFNEVVFYF